MPYQKVATANSPALVIYLIDTSRSMSSQLQGSTRIQIVNEILAEVAKKMVFRSTKGTKISPRYRLAFIAYGEGAEILQGVQTIDKYVSEGIFRFEATGDWTNTASAFLAAEDILKQELPHMQACPAPLICHLTDGEFNAGGDPLPIAKRIMSMGVPDGNVLIENIFIGNDILRSPISDICAWHGVDPADVADNYAQTLLQMSSLLPEELSSAINNQGGYSLEANRPMMFPGENVELVKLAFTLSGLTGAGGPG